MNRIFKSIWNKSLNTWVAVSETASNKGGGASSCLVDRRSASVSALFKLFRIKPFIATLSMALGLSMGLSSVAIAAPVFETVSSTTDVGMMHLSTNILGSGALGNPSQLTTGSYDFKYVTIMFRPTNTDMYYFGQTYSVVDTVMILYGAGFDPTSPGTGALKGNDDTSEANHRAALGTYAPAVIKCGNQTGWCPQVGYSVEAGKVYTLVVSLYNGPRDNTLFTTPFDFYASQDGEFRLASALSPIDTSQLNLASNLDFLIKREFKGGVLKMDQDNGLYALSFTLHNSADFNDPINDSNRIDQNGKTSTFSGAIRDCDASCGTYAAGPGAITITNSGTGGKVIFSGNNTYTGGTIIDANATLSISKDINLGAASGALTFTGGVLENTAQMTSARTVTLGNGGGTFKTIADLTLSGQVSSASGGGLTKTGNGTLTLTNASNVVDHVMVSEGNLKLDQNGTFTVNGDYTTATGAQTTLGSDQTYLNVTETFKQEADSKLSITINNDGQPDITAKNAILAGIISIDGFSNGAPPPKASVISNNAYRHVLIHTTGSISGDFDNAPLGPQGADYLLHQGYINGNDYELGFKLAWIDGGIAHGTGSFTMNAGSVFEVDLALDNQAGSFTSGWNGKDLSKKGDGELILSANNGYTGTTTVEAGTLTLKDAGSISQSSSVSLSGSSIFDISAITSATEVNNLSGEGDTQIILGSKDLTMIASNDMIHAGSIQGTGALIKQGSADLTFSNDNNTVGDVDVQAGTLRFTQGATTPTPVTTFTVSGAYTTRSGATTELGTNNSVLDITGAFTQESNSTLKIELGAWLAAGRADIIAASATLQGKLEVVGFTPSATPNRSSDLLSSGYKLISTTGGVTGTYSGSDLIGTQDTGLDYLMITSYRDNFNKDLMLGFQLTWLDGGQQFGTGNFTIDQGSFTVDTVLSDQTGFTGGLSNKGWNGKDLTKNGVGILRLDEEHLYTGKTTVNAGTLQALSDHVFAHSSAIIIRDGVLDLNDTNQLAHNLTGAGEITLGSGNLTVENATLADSTRYDGEITGDGGLIKTGLGSLTLTNTNNAVGYASVQGGKLVLDGFFATTGDYTTTSGAETILGAGQNYLDVGNIFKQENNSKLSVTLNNSGQPDITAKQAILGGTIEITGFTDGPIPIKASDVQINNYTLIRTTDGISGDFVNSPLQTSSGLDYLIHDGFITSDAKEYRLGFELAWGSGKKATATGSFTLNENTSFDQNLVLSDQTLPIGGFDSGWDGRSLTKNGEGTLILSAQNTYTGTTTIHAGELRTNKVNAFAQSSRIIVDGGILNLNGKDQQANQLSGNGGEVQLNGGATLIAKNQTAGANDSIFGGNFTGDGNLVKSGSGVLTLTGNASHTGLTTVSDGSLMIGNGGTTGSINGNILNNATLTFNRSDDSSYSGILSGSGALHKQGDGVLALTGANSQQGNVKVEAGTLKLAQQGVFGITGDYTTQSGATTDINLANTQLNIGGVLNQSANSALRVTLGASPDILANSANLNGKLFITGFSDTIKPVKASEVAAREYTLIHTINGISGSFTNSSLVIDGVDYLLLGGYITPDKKDYQLDFNLAWTHGQQAKSTGNFTLASGTSFDQDLVLSDQTVPSGGFDSSWDGRSLTKQGEGTLVLSTQNAYTGKTTVSAGELKTNAANAFKQSSDVVVNAGILNLNNQDQHANRLSGRGGEIQLGNATLTAYNATIADNSQYDGKISGEGNLLKDGAGRLTLTGRTEWTGITYLKGGELVLDGSAGGGKLTSDVVGERGSRLSLLKGASLTGKIDPTDVTIDSTSQWQMTNSSLISAMTLAGKVEFAQPAGSIMQQGRVLTASNWQGQGGTVTLYSVLGDDSSVTDKIVIDGGQATGKTNLRVVNAGGLGAPTTGDGIKVIDAINGATTEAEAFALTESVSAGAYEYYLLRQDISGLGESWYLRTQSGNPYRQEVYVHNPINSVLQQVTREQLGSYHERVAGQQVVVDANGQHSNNGWGRFFGQYAKIDHGGDLLNNGSHYTLDTQGFQMGGDIIQRKQANSGDLGGLYVGIVSARARVDGSDGNRAGDINLNTYSVGAYWTHLNSDGWYSDAVLQLSYYGGVKSQSTRGMQFKTSGWGVTASLEGGYGFSLGDGWRLEPQAQLLYVGTSLKDGQDNAGRIDLSDTHAGYGRIGIRLGKESEDRVNGWLSANLWQNITGEGKTTFSDLSGSNSVTTSSKLGGSWLQLGAGLSGRVSKNTTVFVGIDYDHGLGSNKGTSIGGRIGINILF